MGEPTVTLNRLKNQSTKIMFQELQRMMAMENVPDSLSFSSTDRPTCPVSVSYSIDEQWICQFKLYEHSEWKGLCTAMHLVKLCGEPRGWDGLAKQFNEGPECRWALSPHVVEKDVMHGMGLLLLKVDKLITQINSVSSRIGA